MANRIYIRKLDEHCVNKEISLTIDVHQKIFLNEYEFDIVGKRSKKNGKMYIRNAKDRRLGGQIKSIIKEELMGREISSTDILVISSIKDKTYSVEVIHEEDLEYVVFDDLCGDERHTIICASKTGPVDSVDVLQLIKYGVPGTGKSYGITQLIKDTYADYDDTGSNEYVFRTTLHQEYSYYDFVGATYPTTDSNGKIDYKFKPGIFTEALCKAFAEKDNNNKIYLVLEEMSRANVAAVFGDLFQLLDRNENGESEYKIKHDLISNYLSEKNIQLDNKNIYLPSNLYIYGTVNTSDQNVFVMDNAFKRRFEFEYVNTKPVTDQDGNYLNDYFFNLEDNKYSWIEFYQKFNRYVVNNMELREDKQIGPFFIKFKVNVENSDSVEKYNYNQILNKLLQYMWEDVHKCAMAQKPLFKDNISTFGEAYDLLEQKKNIFCDEFNSLFSDLKSEIEKEPSDSTENVDGEYNETNGIE